MSPQDDIRRLTALINILNPQLDTPTEHTSKDSIAKFYGHVSNILTTGRGSLEVLAIPQKGPLKGIRTRTMRPPELSVAENDVEAAGHPGHSQNSRAKKLLDRNITVCIHEIDLNNKVIAGPGQMLSGEQLFSNEVVEVFQKLRDPVVNHTVFPMHVLRQRIPKIETRIKAFDYFFTESLDNILLNWVPTAVNIPTPIRVTLVPFMHSPLEESNMTWVLVGKERESEINDQNLVVWIKILGRAIHLARKSASRFRDAEKSDNPIGADAEFRKFFGCYQVIDEMQRVIAKHPELLDETSLKDDLFLHLKDSSSKPGAEDNAADADHTELGLKLEDEEAQCLRKPLKSSGTGMSAFIDRYLRNVVSVQTSALAIARSGAKFFSTETKLTMHYATASHPDDIPSNFIPLLEHAIPGYFNPRRKASFLEKWTLRLPKGPLRGTVHCEALLMSLATTQSPASALGLTDQQLQVYKDSNRRIGVANKCCWTCNWLVKQLNMLNRYDLLMEASDEFATPATHGIVFPWAAPPGLSENVCLQLVRGLKRELANTVERLMEADANPTLQSALSSPASSASGSSLLDEITASVNNEMGFVEAYPHLF